ncbi:MAG: N-acetyltransferase family protein [Dehalococcoidia bacterium]
MANTPTTVSIRSARAGDLPRLLELFLQLSESSQYPEDEIRPVTGAHYAALQRIDADPNVRVLVAEEDERIVGTLALYLMPNLSHGGRPFAIVENVVVDASQRGTGLGRRLMAEAERIATEADCYKVGLTSNNKRAPAHAFYETIGYAHTHKGFTRYVEDHPM